jgi:putative MATE family efflux protein
MRRFPTATDHEIARLAIPAFGALIAEPLYVLSDTAVVGHLGTPELGGLAIAGQALLTVHAVMIFLAYGTTAAVARLIGAGDERAAAHQAVQSLWLAVAIGIVSGLILFAAAEPIVEALGAEGAIREHSLRYLRVSILGLPAMLISLAAVGYLRGLQDTVRPLVVALVTAVGNLVLEIVLIFGFDQGIGASALSTVVAQWAGAVLYLIWVGRAVAEHGISLRPERSAMAQLAKVAGDLMIRTTALRASFTVTVAAAARIDSVSLAAHEIAFQLWMFIALALDAVAIAGQALMGRVLGAGDAAAARRVGDRMIAWGAATGIAALLAVVVTRPWLADLFSDDAAVIAVAGTLFWHLALMQPINGVVFALDGILIGAGDMRFLAWAMTGAAAAFIPLAILVPVLDLGVVWLWGALWVLMAVRLAALWVRYRGGSWLVTGALRS